MKIEKEGSKATRVWVIHLTQNEMLNLHTGLSMSTATESVADLAEEIGDALENKTMTWGEFKAYVDAELESIGSGNWEKIWYIDVSFPEPDDLSIGVDPDEGISVCV